MPSKILAYLTESYRESSLQIRKKSRILGTIAFVFGIASLVFVAIMAATKAVTVAFVFMGIALFCSIVLGLLRAGRYNLASSLFLYGLFGAMFVAIKFDAYQDVYETYVFGTLGCFLLVVATLVADRPSLPVILAILSLAAIEALYWLDAYPLEGKVTLLAIQNLATPSLLLVLGGGVSAWIVSFNKKLILEVERRAEGAATNYEHLNAAMGAAQSDSLAVGERLSAGAARSMETLGSLRERVLGIARGMDELTAALGRSSAANAEAVSRQDDVGKALVAYSEEVSRASSAIEQMAAAVSGLGSQAGHKVEAVQDLVTMAKAGEGLLSSMSASIGEILDSAKRMAEMNVFIGDVADRTNLLGMNASIEAAHAGSVGKGFAVVADQIRALSVEAGNSSRVISDTLRGTQAAVQAAAAKNQEALDFFRKISGEIQGVGGLLEELLANLRELSTGSDDVLRAVSAVAELTNSTERTVAESRSSITRSSEGISSVASIAKVVHQDSSEMPVRFDEVRKDVAEVERLGGDNLRTIQSLRDSLELFQVEDRA